MNEKQIEHLMKSLDCTREEAISIIEEDEAIDRMKDKDVQNDLTEEQKKASKQARQADRKKTSYKFDTSKRERKVDPIKKELIAGLASFLTEQGATDIDITNDQRQIDFLVDATRYRIVLSAPRK